MEANARHLRNIFEQTCHYVVPLVQRPYVWEQGRQWEPRWDDLRKAAERRLAGGDGKVAPLLGAVGRGGRR